MEAKEARLDTPDLKKCCRTLICKHTNDFSGCWYDRRKGQGEKNLAIRKNKAIGSPKVSLIIY